MVAFKVDKEAAEELVPPVPLGGSKKQDEDDNLPEPEPPEDFEWTDDMDQDASSPPNQSV